MCQSHLDRKFWVKSHNLANDKVSDLMRCLHCLFNARIYVLSSVYIYFLIINVNDCWYLNSYEHEEFHECFNVCDKQQESTAKSFTNVQIMEFHKRTVFVMLMDVKMPTSSIRTVTAAWTFSCFRKLYKKTKLY